MKLWDTIKRSFKPWREFFRRHKRFRVVLWYIEEFEQWFDQWFEQWYTDEYLSLLPRWILAISAGVYFVGTIILTIKKLTWSLNVTPLFTTLDRTSADTQFLVGAFLTSFMLIAAYPKPKQGSMLSDLRKVLIWVLIPFYGLLILLHVRLAIITLRFLLFPLFLWNVAIVVSLYLVSVTERTADEKREADKGIRATH